MIIFMFRILFVLIMLGITLITFRACLKIANDWKQKKLRNIFRHDDCYIIKKSYKNDSNNIYNSSCLTMYCPNRDNKLLCKSKGLFM